ncbi:MAG: DUF192 domain-containing protein [Candidatus Micrarchaeota archaeon]|nr:DUF192 domain-containing protein [Candidatus Micrarchaeota archaeon]
MAMRVPVLVMDSFFKRFRGLMFAWRVEKPLLFVFPQAARHGIHSFFCPAFDAVFLDAGGVVVGVFRVRHWGPWFAPDKPATYLIEAAPGFADRIKMGQSVRVDVDGAWLDAG